MKALNLKSAYQSKFSTRIFIIFLLFIISLSSVLTAIFVRHQKTSLTENLIYDGLSIVSLVSHNAKLGVFTENPDFLVDVIEGAVNHKGVLSCDIFTLDGRNLNKRDGNEKANESQMKIMEEVGKSKEAYYVEHPGSFVFWAPVISKYYSPHDPSEESLFFDGTDESIGKSRVTGFVRMRVSKEDLISSFEAILVKSLFISVLFAVIASIAAFILSKKVTTPLKRLNEGVQALGRGDLSTQVRAEGTDEIGELASGFNNMVRLLKEREEEKRKLTEQLNKSERLESMGIFAGGISHDFNNILTIIQSNMHLAETKAPGYLQGYIQKTLEATKRGTELILKLLHFTQDSQMMLEMVNVGLVVQETSNLFDKTLDSRIRINVNSGPDLWRVKGDAGQIQQVVMNLYLNARDAIMEKIQGCRSEGGADGPFHIGVDLRNTKVTQDLANENPRAHPGEFVLLSVSDGGCGMDAEVREHIFEPFFTTKEVGRGTGIGLSSVYGIVNRFGGWIDVWSEPGEGSIFRVYFPKYTSTTREPETETREKEYEYAGGNETILLVDDEEHILASMEEKLCELGYQVITASDGEEAIEVLSSEERKIDLIVLDEVMPRRSGLEVLGQVRQKWSNTKVILYSGKDLSQYSHALEVEGVELIRKPCSPDNLAGRIREILGAEVKYPLKSNINRVKYYFVREKTVPYNEELSDSSTAYKLFRHIANEPREKFLALFLDSQNKVIAYDSLSSGTTNETVVYPKEVVRTALLTNASSVILLHNHPSGELKPSNHDLVITAAISQACEVVDIRVADHLIIAEKGFYSFLSEGLL